MKLGWNTQVRAGGASQSRRVLAIALVLLLAVAVLAPNLHLRPGHRPAASPSRSSSARGSSASAASAESTTRAAHGAHVPRPTPGPGVPHSVAAHAEPLLAQIDDSSALRSFASTFVDAAPTATTMLAVGVVIGSLVAFAQSFMSRASRTRGQPATA